ncbi:MAG: hypothetical protein ACOCP8_04560 [archaeon]
MLDFDINNEQKLDNKKLENFKKEMIDGYNKLDLNTKLIFTTSINTSWEVIYDNTKEYDRKIIVSLKKLKKAINTEWYRAALHELCHIKCEEFYDINLFSFNPFKTNTTLNNLPFNSIYYREFIADWIYLKYFKNKRKWFKPNETKTIINSYKEILNNIHNNKINPSTIHNITHNLLYLWYCNFLSNKYNLDRIVLKNMIKSLKKYNNIFKKVINKLDRYYSNKKILQNKLEYKKYKKNTIKILVKEMEKIGND